MSSSSSSDDIWRIATVTAQKCSSFLSIMGSGNILVQVIRSRAKRSKVVFRLLAAMSASDLVCSIWFFVGTWAVPAGTPGIPSGVGTELTCNIQAFFLYAAVTTLNFNACLALYYLMSIRFGWREDAIRKYVEPYCYVYAITIGLVVGIVPLVMDLFNPSNFWCSIKPKPNAPTGVKYIWLLFYVPAWFTILFVTVTMLIIYVHVRSTEKRAQRHDFNKRRITTSSAVSHDDDDDDDQASICSAQSAQSYLSIQSVQSRISKISSSVMSSWGTVTGANHTVSSEQLQRRRNKQTAKVATQAFWYCLVFYLTLVFPTTTRAMQMAGAVPVPKPILFLFMVFYPAQGFMNWLVYMRPRWVAKAKQAARKRRQKQRNNQQRKSGRNGHPAGNHTTTATTTTTNISSTAINNNDDDDDPTTRNSILPLSIKIRKSSMWGWRNLGWSSSSNQQQQDVSSSQIHEGEDEEVVDDRSLSQDQQDYEEEEEDEYDEEEDHYIIQQEEQDSPPDNNNNKELHSDWDAEAACIMMMAAAVTNNGAEAAADQNDNDNDREHAWKQSLEYAKRLQQDEDNNILKNSTATAATTTSGRSSFLNCQQEEEEEEEMQQS